MKTIGRITRILAYLIFIILGVLAIATPILLEDYWFSGGIQHDFECIALVMDNPLCQAGFLVIGIVGVLGNVLALWFSAHGKKAKNGSEFLSDVIVWATRFIVSVVVLIFTASGNALMDALESFNTLLLSLAAVCAAGSLAAIVVGVATRNKKPESGTLPEKEEKEAAEDAPEALSAPEGRKAPEKAPLPEMRPIPSVRPVPPVAPMQQYAPVAREDAETAPSGYDAYGGWYDEAGGYHDAYGGWYDVYGGYHAADGNYYPPEGRD